ncbi:hypothetical protein [Streptomyces phaeochromogenes]|uniref:hypothetical protein n=1 Tax=Streptomyces phaeochromogenes TaxID=1923 RepID=UPI003865B544|nr:hypothetical protein OG277_26085 [Streptomyces phaeochromogenes]
MTPAALAVIRAALEDATTRELLTRPGSAAVRVAQTLEDAGLMIVPIPEENGPHRAA